MECPSKTTIAYVSWVSHDLILLWPIPSGYSHHDAGSYENISILKSLWRPSLSLLSFFSSVFTLWNLFSSCSSLFQNFFSFISICAKFLLDEYNLILIIPPLETRTSCIFPRSFNHQRISARDLFPIHVSNIVCWNSLKLSTVWKKLILVICAANPSHPHC